MTEDASPLRVERDGAVAVLTLDRPSVLNALDRPLVEALIAAFAEIAADPDVRCVLLRGSGRAFSAGGDLTAFLAMDAPTFSAFIDLLQELARRMRRLRVPTIAAVHGYVLAGGFELAAACDIRIAAEDTVFGLPDTAIGLSPTSGLSYLLPRIVGGGWARDLLLAGERIDAARALAIGLVTRVVAADELSDAALALARTVAGHPPEAVERIKAELRLGTDDEFEFALAEEARHETACFGTDEFRARIEAFARRRRDKAS